MTTPCPTLAGFTDFVTNVMGISTTFCPADSPNLGYAFDVAIDTVNRTLQQVVPFIYTLAVYNLAGDNLINWCPDQPGQTYFKTLRTTFGCTTFVAGVVSGSGDEGTSSSLTVPAAFSRLTFSDLQNLKTPYGRQYLAFAQKYGTLWGMS